MGGDEGYVQTDNGDAARRWASMHHIFKHNIRGSMYARLYIATHEAYLYIGKYIKVLMASKLKTARSFGLHNAP